MSKLKIGVLVSGSGTNLQAIINSARTGYIPCEIAVVISDKADAYALQRADIHGITKYVVSSKAFPNAEAYDGELVKILKQWDVDLVVLAGFMRIVTPVLINTYPHKIMNIHPSLLPAFPGLQVQKKALEYGARFSGCTAHFVDEGVDTGPIIIQAVVPILADDSEETLTDRILSEEHRIYPYAIKLFAEGRLEVQGRRVLVKDHPAIEGVLENPLVK